MRRGLIQKRNSHYKRIMQKNLSNVRMIILYGSYAQGCPPILISHIFSLQIALYNSINIAIHSHRTVIDVPMYLYL